ncbi:cell division protein ZapE [Amycolatopsis cynarae]|uniref:Cell division protein ZapE n=1 Tax=Amycolatopsis cynarae TaxID=2995223 RepID=A0ABY7BA98_9PSEU|nr:cell division protein ZapE [Amycolatopsis sp. HUAS 11-8]WAL69280.1 cell division protein ZapE [Amycolatopsis sp. HUAS 11-8]
MGRGKTWLLDTFFAAVPGPAKKRVHFHDFFRSLHLAVRRHRDEHDAIAHAVSDLLAGCRLLCFDEFHVHDVGDAMHATHLLRDLFARGVVLVCTSNYPPSGLLPDPLFHDRFLPGIQLLETHLDVFEVAGPRDYRRSGGAGKAGFAAGMFASPGDDRHLAGLGLVPPAEAEATLVPLRSHAIAARDAPAVRQSDRHPVRPGAAAGAGRTGPARRGARGPGSRPRHRPHRQPAFPAPPGRRRPAPTVPAFARKCPHRRSGRTFFPLCAQHHGASGAPPGGPHPPRGGIVILSAARIRARTRSVLFGHRDRKAPQALRVAGR